MWVVCSPIFVADTKIIFGYDFVAPLTMKKIESQNPVLKIQRHIEKLSKILFFSKNYYC